MVSSITALLLQTLFLLQFNHSHQSSSCTSTALLTILQLPSASSHDRLAAMLPIVLDNRLHYCKHSNTTCIFATTRAPLRFVKLSKYIWIRRLLRRSYCRVLFLDADVIITKHFDTQAMQASDSSGSSAKCSVLLTRDLPPSPHYSTGVMLFTASAPMTTLSLLRCMTLPIANQTAVAVEVLADGLVSDQLLLNLRCLNSNSSGICAMSRVVWNAFPTVIYSNTSVAGLWHALGLPMHGDEVSSTAHPTHITHLVHFAGEFGGKMKYERLPSSREVFRDPFVNPFALLLTLEEMIERHLLYLRDVSSATGPTTALHRSMTLMSAMRDWLMSCISAINQAKIEIEDSEVWRCIRDASRKTEILQGKDMMKLMRSNTRGAVVVKKRD